MSTLKILPTNGRANGPGGKFGVFLNLRKSTSRRDAKKNKSRRTKKLSSHIVAGVRSSLFLGANQCVSSFCFDPGSLASLHTKASVKDVDRHTFYPLSNSFFYVDTTTHLAHKEKQSTPQGGNPSIFCRCRPGKVEGWVGWLVFPLFPNKFIFCLDRALFAGLYKVIGLFVMILCSDHRWLPFPPEVHTAYPK